MTILFVDFQLIALMAIRKLMDFVFTQSDLYWLDHLLPEEARREKEDQHKVRNLIFLSSAVRAAINHRQHSCCAAVLKPRGVVELKGLHTIPCHTHSF